MEESGERDWVTSSFVSPPFLSLYHSSHHVTRPNNSEIWTGKGKGEMMACRKAKNPLSLTTVPSHSIISLHSISGVPVTMKDSRWNGEVIE